MGRVLEKEVMEAVEEAEAYDELDRLWGNVLFQGFAESALHMGVMEGRVLDVGCGPGRISVRLAKLNSKFSIEGIDLSQSMLDLATQTARNENVFSSIRFSIGDAKQIPFPDQAFDLVICHNFLHQLPDPAVAVAEINRVAKSSGAILIRDVRRLPEPWMAAVLPLYCIGYGQVLKRLTYDSYHAGLTLQEFSSMIESAGITRGLIRSYFISHVGLEKTALPYRSFSASKPTSGAAYGNNFLKSFYVSNPHLIKEKNKKGS